MAFQPKIIRVKNVDASAQPINDLGIPDITASAYRDLHLATDPNTLSVAEIMDSLDLKSGIDSDLFLINVGADTVDDLTKEQSQQYLEFGNGLTADQVEGVKSANNPSSTNPFLTNNDIGSIGQDSLDSAYDFTGSGAGRSITVDSGEVELTGQAANNAALRLAPRTTISTVHNNGSIDNVEDAAGNVDLSVYDGSRTKLFVVGEEKHIFINQGNIFNKYVEFNGVRSNVIGSPVLENSTITKIVIQNANTVTGNIILRKQSALGTDIHTVALTAATGATERDIDVDLNAGDQISVFYDGVFAQRMRNLIVVIYTKVRK